MDEHAGINYIINRYVEKFSPVGCFALMASQSAINHVQANREHEDDEPKELMKKGYAKENESERKSQIRHAVRRDAKSTQEYEKRSEKSRPSALPKGNDRIDPDHSDALQSEKHTGPPRQLDR